MTVPSPSPHRAPVKNPPPAGPGSVAGRIAYWLPVAVPLGLFAQIALLGLRPALADRAHLERMEVEMRTRLEADEALNEELSLRREAREDPIFRERQRRARALSWTGR
jgi:hypothetical protein